MRLEGGSEEKVRFIGIEALESTSHIEPFDNEAAAYAKVTYMSRRST
ncbi:hypothetical protein [Moorella sp. Hama-1]|nr:hypothetical protein [Moorella sp. Hama-1]MDN5361400.1 hypothetical protein [Moorella sp. (in: firmicutes)]BCV22130.1 hypothetical protein hamaS1_21990 [Moorella sp. Hama-1]